jgi:hypothetical protein
VCRPQPGRYRRIGQHAFSRDPVACKSYARNSKRIDRGTTMPRKDSGSNRHLRQKADHLRLFAPTGYGKIDELFEFPAVERRICTPAQIFAGVYDCA